MLPSDEATIHIFKRNKKIFRQNELKSWLVILSSATLAYFGLSFFGLMSKGGLVIVIVIMLFDRLLDRLLQYHVIEIQVDHLQNDLTFILASGMSGEKVKRYQLDQAKSGLTVYTGLKKHLSSAFILKIFIDPNQVFRITDRYGFSLQTSTLVDKEIRSSTNVVASQ